MKENIYPKWIDLPEFDLYLDQVLLYVNQLDSTAVVHGEKGLTSAMINNYVKHGYLDKPIKKKYTRRQLARLIVITCLKNVFSIQEVSKTVKLLTKNNQSEKMYDNFVRCMNGEESDDIPAAIILACRTIRLYQQTHMIVEDLEKQEEV
ncbi:hypothetical protein AXE85_03210 [Gemella sp. oral taxon 928]|uniref:DUF1836 domain-containing protein n=1 Tax=unclassified Gemella TaxID=2624949 RepID=UPI0007683681|nr:MULTISPECIES: DUF1836 domain-containing protein [unclassified Gemella]AME09229.1 hypothetical protein AXE85_03210 [Gemella sp. oral taxon 928]AXI26862.1 DUF1836 domain-containing protein [Gemella sp. ND 6198]